MEYKALPTMLFFFHSLLFRNFAQGKLGLYNLIFAGKSPQRWHMMNVTCIVSDLIHGCLQHESVWNG